MNSRVSGNKVLLLQGDVVTAYEEVIEAFDDFCKELKDNYKYLYAYDELLDKFSALEEVIYDIN